MATWKDSPLVKAKDRKAWRAWLAKNHAKETKAWLVIPHKGKVRTDLNYNSAVEEALCFVGSIARRTSMMRSVPCSTSRGANRRVYGALRIVNGLQG